MTSSEPPRQKQNDPYPKKGRKPEKRAWALRRARQVLVTQSGFAGQRELSAVDLVALAEYITTGEDPWPSPITRHEVSVEVHRHHHASGE